MIATLPLLPQQLHDATPAQDAADMLHWMHDVCMQLLEQAAPSWSRNGGQGLDLEDAATLQVAVARIREARHNLLQKEEAASCQNAATSPTPK